MLQFRDLIWIILYITGMMQVRICMDIQKSEAIGKKITDLVVSAENKDKFISYVI
jgi:hypothetical protein